ncbi:MAG: antibiotic biosynthesis monooxygenase [Proteobacteria bacterium]|nr:antibiotic biosynthesis monooxygenase [Pseudomonadota bacterium]
MPLVVVRFEPKPGMHAQVEAVLRPMVPATRAEAGNRRYDLFGSVDASGGEVFYLVEQYADDAAVAAHRESAHYLQYRAVILPLLLQPPQVQMLRSIDARPY